MARCGCSGATCNCVVQNGAGTTVSGAGTLASPYRVAVNLDPDAGNLLTATDDGLLVDCDAVAACVAGTTPGGQTDFNDSPGVDFTKTGSGTAIDPFQVTGDLKAVYLQSAAVTFTHNLTGASAAWEKVTEVPDLTIVVAGVYEVSWMGRGTATIPGSTAAVSTSTSCALYKNGVLVPATETQLTLVSQGVASTAEPALQMQGSGGSSVVVTCNAGDTLSLYAMRQAVASGTNSIISNTDGRCRLTARRIGA